MHRFIQSDAGTVLFRMTTDAESYVEMEGRFEVRFQRTQTRIFSTLLEAFLFYYTLDDEAELWDKTEKPLFIEQKIKLFLN